MRTAASSPLPGTQTTIGFWLTCPFDVIVKCPWCGNNRTLTAEKAVARYGPDVTVRDYFGRLRCYATPVCRHIPPRFEISYHRHCRLAGGK